MQIGAEIKECARSHAVAESRTERSPPKKNLRIRRLFVIYFLFTDKKNKPILSPHLEAVGNTEDSCAKSHSDRRCPGNRRVSTRSGDAPVSVCQGEQTIVPGWLADLEDIPEESTNLTQCEMLFLFQSRGRPRCVCVCVCVCVWPKSRHTMGERELCIEKHLRQFIGENVPISWWWWWWWWLWSSSSSLSS